MEGSYRTERPMDGVETEVFVTLGVCSVMIGTDGLDVMPPMRMMSIGEMAPLLSSEPSYDQLIAA